MNIEINKKTVGIAIGAKAALLLIGAFFWAAPALAQTAGNISNMTTLDVSAHVDVNASPDIAQISAGVVTDGKSAQAALKENAEKMTTVFAAIKAANVPEKDIQTAGVNVSAQYSYVENQPPKVTGYQATNNVNIKLHDLKNIGKVLDTLVEQGANQLNGPTFSVDDEDKVLDDARAQAIEKAKKRADLYAAAAGLKVKRIINISEAVSNDGPRPYPMMAKRMMAQEAASSSPVSVGEVSLGVTVNVTYELTP